MRTLIFEITGRVRVKVGAINGTRPVKPRAGDTWELLLILTQPEVKRLDAHPDASPLRELDAYKLAPRAPAETEKLEPLPELPPLPSELAAPPRPRPRPRS